MPNPFVTADRVPPPVAHAAPAQAAPYYNPAPALTPAPGSPGVYPAPAPLNQSAPQQAAPTFQGTLGAPQPAPAPLGRSGTSGSPLAKAGDAVSVPTDASPLRFGSPARPAISTPGANTLAGGTANGWIAGSAPVRRPTTPTSAPRARIPAGATTEPLSLAALGNGRGQVQITPLDSTPPRPVSVADSQGAAATWR